MKTIKNCGAQGDCYFRRVAAIPPGAVEDDRHDGALVVAHSETQHHHTVADAAVRMFSVPGEPLVAYLEVKAPHADVVHQRPWDTHETLRLLSDCPEGATVIWEIRRQREHTPEGWQRVCD